VDDTFISRKKDSLEYPPSRRTQRAHRTRPHPVAGTRRASFPDLLGRVYLHQGRHDEALAEWRIGFENGWRDHLFYISPEFDPVRDDPRFRALLDDRRADFDRQRRALERDGLAIAE
jgi:hypothetical protein